MWLEELSPAETAPERPGGGRCCGAKEQRARHPSPQPTPHTSTPLAESEIELILGWTHAGEVIDRATLEVQDPDLRTSCTRGGGGPTPARPRRHVGVVSVASNGWGGGRAGPQTGMQETRGEALVGAGAGDTSAGVALTPSHGSGGRAAGRAPAGQGTLPGDAAPPEAPSAPRSTSGAAALAAGPPSEEGTGVEAFSCFLNT